MLRQNNKVFNLSGNRKNEDKTDKKANSKCTNSSSNQIDQRGENSGDIDVYSKYFHPI